MAALGISRVGVDTVGGGLIIGPGVPTVLCRGFPVSVTGDAVASHGSSPHDAATTVGTSTKVRVRGQVPVRAGDVATCGDAATGAPDARMG